MHKGRTEGRMQYERFWKTHECMFSQIPRETILLLDNNIYRND